MFLKIVFAFVATVLLVSVLIDSMSNSKSPAKLVKKGPASVEPSFPLNPTTALPTIYTAQEICELDRKAPLTEYQRNMCKSLARTFAKDPVMVEIAFCESGWRHQNDDGSVRTNENPDEHKSVDVGLFQINMYWNGKAMQDLGLDAKDVRHNVKYTKQMRQNRGYLDWKSSIGCWGKVVAKTEGTKIALK